MPSSTIDNTAERQQPHIDLQTTNSSSASSSTVTLQRSGSIGHIRRLVAVPQNAQPPVHVSNATANISKPVTSPESKRRPSHSHSRSNSIGRVRDGVGNLNRWSESTTSSKGSTAHGRSSSFSRRMSFGGSGAFTFGVPTSQSANKLQKSRPPTAEELSRHPPTIRPFESQSNPALSLPPIVTLPTLQQSVNDLSSPQTATTTTPSTAGLLSAAVRQAVPDYFGKTWDEPISRESTQLKAPFQGRSQVDPPQSSLKLAGKTHSSGSPVKRPREEGENGGGIDRGHSRNRSQAGKDSSGTTSSDKSRSPKHPSQKAMLSKALQKANTAVLLDNAQNFEGAMQAYSEACNLLQQVMLRSSGDEDKRKLEAIRSTYTTRITELEKIMPSLRDDDGKALPARPPSNDYKDDDLRSPTEDDENAVIETATVARIVNDESYKQPPARPIPTSQLPQRRESLLHAAFDPAPYKPRNLADQYYPSRSYSKSPMRERITETSVNLAPPMDREYMPPPLSPRRPTTPSNQTVPKSNDEKQRLETTQTNSSMNTSPGQGHRRAASTESMSWLDTIDESAGSTASSVHSRTSSFGVRRKHIRGTSGATEAEFDAALDAAVEAAYDDGFEPADEPVPIPEIVDYDDEIVANVRRRVELAKERVRETEREAAIQYARDRDRARLLKNNQGRPESMEAEYDGNESEEEERMIEEMTRGYVMDDFEFGLQSKSALPRESDSSGFSGRTWNSSIGSNPTTAGTSLSTVIEKTAIPEMPSLQSKPLPPSHPPPALALPLPPVVHPSSAAKVGDVHSTTPLPPQSVRNRRLSGQTNPKQLKIETAARITLGPLTQPPQMPPPQVPSLPQPPNTTGVFSHLRQPQINGVARPPLPQPVHQASSPFPGTGSSEVISPPTPTLTHTLTHDSDNGIPRSGSPGRAQSRSGLRKNFSSSSLKNLKNRNLSVSNLDNDSDVSPNTPMSTQFSTNSGGRDAAGRLPAMPTLPTPIATAFRDKMNGASMGGLYLFQSDINSPETPGTPGVGGSSAPIPLEHCPTEFLLRPFWLMRALYQTIAHPRGGYLSTKLFIPRDVWRVKGVKIKSVEDKISNCDFLTAALQKLAKVDTYDADAVLEEMQALESVLDQVQATLTKKLGNEVGVQGSGILFRDASTPNEAESGAVGSKNSNAASKSSFSWRRLRSKNSAVGLTNNYAGKTAPIDGPKEGLTMSTLPMTSLGTVRFAKRDVASIQFSGPNANYMGALARLFDAAQVIDEIARQVEDPGLRHADKTQVGLELSTRHAAEFFGFYVCRFILTDVSLLLDKFIKRGSEWVLV